MILVSDVKQGMIIDYGSTENLYVVISIRPLYDMVRIEVLSLSTAQLFDWTLESTYKLHADLVM